MEGPYLHSGAAHLFGIALDNQGLCSSCSIPHDGNEFCCLVVVFFFFNRFLPIISKTATFYYSLLLGQFYFKNVLIGSIFCVDVYEAFTLL